MKMHVNVLPLSLDPPLVCTMHVSNKLLLTDDEVHHVRPCFPCTAHPGSVYVFHK